MNTIDAIDTIRTVLDTPTNLPRHPHATPAETEAVEKLIRAAAVVLSIDDPRDIVDGIVFEARNRIMIANAIGKKPWEDFAK